MKIIECLYTNLDEFKHITSDISFKQNTLIQIFTATLQKEEALKIAQELQIQYPKAHIIGSSVGAVLFEGHQYENETLVVVEQFDETQVATHLCNVTNLQPEQIVNIIKDNGCVENTQLLRIFFGNCYRDAHQFVECFNTKTSHVKMVGGMAGDGGTKNIHPYVFNSEYALEEACVFAVLSSDTLNTFSGVNISHEPVSEVCTITKCNGSDLLEINEKPAADWFQDKLGYLSTDVYTTWEEIATCDPLMRFQIQLEGHNGASRFIKYNNNEATFSQYFTYIDEGTKFKLSYTSPAKCVDETKTICTSIQDEKIEHLFTYSCLLRKMFLQNCSSWEISPFQKSKLSGVFLLGEFGAISNQYNEFLNGSCVYSGIAEEEAYVDIDAEAFENLKKIQAQEKDLLDFIKRKRSAIKSNTESEVLNHVILNEHARQDYKYKDENFNMNNILKYEAEKDILRIDKLCLIKIENAQDIIGHYGQDKYFDQMKHIIFMLKELNVVSSIHEEQILDYTISFDTFVLAGNSHCDYIQFLSKMRSIDEMILKQQNQASSVPLITRFVIVEQRENLLEDAYTVLQKNKDTQQHFIITDTTDNTDGDLIEEFEVLKDLNSALVDNRIVPFYQGIRNNETGRIDKYEALIRIVKKDGEILSPFKFLDVAKKHRLYLRLTCKMIDAVLKDFNDVDCEVSINVSYLDISSKPCIEYIKERLKTFNKPERLIFEILEDECFKEVDALKKFIDEVRALNAKVAIDDFGAGYSNLLEIIRIKPDFIKIDGQIIRDIHNNLENKLVLQLITSLAQDLQVKLVAEFVENNEIQQELEKKSVGFSQGYLFSKPAPFSELVFE